MKTKALPLVAMAVVFAGIALTFWAGERRNAMHGPALMAEDSGHRIWVTVAERLYVLGADGALQLDLDPKAIGLDVPVNVLAAVEDGGMVAANDQAARLRFLDRDGKLVETLDPSVTGTGGLRQGFALDYDPVQRRFLVAHTGHHRLLVLDRKGGLLHESGSRDGTPGRYHFPNSIELAADGRIYVPDTNQTEIEVLSEDLQLTHPSVQTPRLEGARMPIAVTRLGSGRLAVVLLDHTMRVGRAALIEPDGSLVRELPLAPRAEPLALVARDSDLLLTDQGANGYEIARFDLDGKRLGAFGDAAFRDVLARGRDARASAILLRDLGRLVTFLGAGLLIVLYLYERGALAPVTATPDPDAEPPPARPLWASLLLSALLPGLGHFNQRRNDDGITHLGIFGFVAVMTGLALFVHSIRLMDMDVRGLWLGATLLALHWCYAFVDVWRHEAPKGS